MGMFCCPECFGDEGLRNNIIPIKSSVRGQCSFCRKDDVLLIEPAELEDSFLLLTGAYEEDPTGMSLIDLMKKDWGLFLASGLGDAAISDLLSGILGVSYVASKTYSPLGRYVNDRLAKWSNFKNEIIGKNRYFLDGIIDLDRLKQLLSYLVLKITNQIWFRSRIMSDNASPYLITEMGAPPPKLASHGRANPVGIPYLYLGSEVLTAITEVRPHPGDGVCVAEFNIAGPITLVNLIEPRRYISPFILSDFDEVGKLRADMPFLEELGAELSRHVLPRSAATDYIPSQYLCEYIKKLGFDGVLYGSSVGPGKNLALFDESKVKGGNVVIYKVDKVSLKASRI